MVRKFWRAMMANPKTSATGISTLVGIGLAAGRDPSILADPVTVFSAIVAVGLLTAADGHQE